MNRELSDAQWARIAGLVPGKATDPGRSGADNRLFIEAVFWMARNGARWRALPERFGRWSTVHKRFARWCQAGVWHRLLEALARDAVFDLVIIDATIIRAHQHTNGAKGGLKLTHSAAPAAA